MKALNLIGILMASTLAASSALAQGSNGGGVGRLQNGKLIVHVDKLMSMVLTSEDEDKFGFHYWGPYSAARKYVGNHSRDASLEDSKNGEICAPYNTNIILRGGLEWKVEDIQLGYTDCGTSSAGQLECTTPYSANCVVENAEGREQDISLLSQ